ncbi:threonylcarbamoyl-AMP synthase [Paludibacter sp. 221]|uniref:L-threonylcarbamoyladenylate synthase n=1 Tax=Paludibacter sp. 221 TaxID=2302939 RepID=UPI0013D48645|nr:L-threonylcarbamoyladenylate synthase [Paludibacter sp. 221]NDV46537.1 threonylcarbamoyl-AMP synthase [Paludibacter sp. 221]
MLLKLYKDNPNPNQIRRIAEVLKNGGIVIIPTDTLYAFACNIFNQAGVETISKIKNKDLHKSNLSFICNEMRQVSEFAKMGDTAFKLMKKNLPGPFTFILNGSNSLPKLFKNKKTVGIRMPQNEIVMEIVRELGNPLMTSSVFYDEDTEYITNPELIDEKYGKMVDIVIDGGEGSIVPSTIIDCTEEEPVIIREGAGILIE